MRRYRVSAEADVQTTPDRAYAMLADYRGGHPAVLPRRYFRDLVVERGGVGHGTVIRFRMGVLGSTRAVRASVTEPEPGRVLAETDLESGAVTTFTVEPTRSGAGTRITIATELHAPDGFWGALERRLVTGLLRRVYAAELELLASHFAPPPPTVFDWTSTPRVSACARRREAELLCS